ncbi:hypothetical protein SynA1560_02477 [Synechococcus sp. A15-60]|nr:hypothetical protein SynA1560_02477 [Synechococcus sp. A15-60]
MWLRRRQTLVSAMTAPRRPLRHVSAVLASLWRVAVWSVTV